MQAMKTYVKVGRILLKGCIDSLSTTSTRDNVEAIKSLPAQIPILSYMIVLTARKSCLSWPYAKHRSGCPFSGPALLADCYGHQPSRPFCQSGSVRLSPCRSSARDVLDPLRRSQALAARDLVQADNVGALGQTAAVVPAGRDLAIAVWGAGGEAFVVAGWAGAVDGPLDVAAPDVPVTEECVGGGVVGGDVGCGGGVGVGDGLGEREGG